MSNKDSSIIAEYGIDPYGFQHYSSSRGREEFHGPCWSASCSTDGSNRDRMTITIGSFEHTDHGLFICRVCNLKGRLDQFVRSDDTDWEQVKKDRRAAAEKAAEEAKAKRLVLVDWLNRTRVHETLHAKIWKQFHILDSLERDGIDEHAIQRWQIGYNPNFVYYVDDQRYRGEVISFPIINKSGKCVNIRMRIMAQVDGNKYRPIRAGLGIHFLYAGYDNDYRIFIVEGEKKAIVLHRYGIPAIGLYGVNSWKPHWGKWIKKNFDKRFVLFDNERSNKGVLLAAQRIVNDADAFPVVVPGKPDDYMNKTKNVNLFFEAMKGLRINEHLSTIQAREHAKITSDRTAPAGVVPVV